MKIVVNLEGTDKYQEIEIGSDKYVYDLLIILQTVFDIPFNNMILKLNGKHIADPYTKITSLKIGDNVLIVSKKSTNLGDAFSQFMNQLNTNNSSSSQQQGMLSSFYSPNYGNNNMYASSTNFFQSQTGHATLLSRAQYIKEKYLNNPEALDRLFTDNPELAEAIVADDDKKVYEFVRRQTNKNESEYNRLHAEYYRLANADPNDAEAQKKIEKLIKQKNIYENYQYAFEHLPETLVPVHMLYIKLEINKTQIVALVDTGAQTTVVSKYKAEKCGLMNLCDERFQGIVQGVGVSKIVGVVHAAQLKIEDKFIMCKITVVESVAVDFIFGLDNMRSHRCHVNLEKNKLVFPDVGLEAKFLSDGEIKKYKDEQARIKEKEDINKAKEMSKKK
jgi:DNA damage-inducible protein 1